MHATFLVACAVSMAALTKSARTTDSLFVEHSGSAALDPYLGRIQTSDEDGEVASQAHYSVNLTFIDGDSALSKICFPGLRPL